MLFFPHCLLNTFYRVECENAFFYHYAILLFAVSSQRFQQNTKISYLL